MKLLAGPHTLGRLGRVLLPPPGSAGSRSSVGPPTSGLGLSSCGFLFSMCLYTVSLTMMVIGGLRAPLDHPG